MGRPLRVLVTGEAGGLLPVVQQALADAGFDPTLRDVASLAECRAALGEGSWDLVLVGHPAPAFAAPEALASVRESCPDVPVIVLSCVDDDGTALAVLRAGADDYLTVRERGRLSALVERRVSQAEKQRRVLDAATRELEAFTYSVSHDLTAPLRRIDGFSRLLQEEYGHQLDERGRHHLQRLRNAAGRMAEMTEALLELSRIGRSDLRRQAVDLTALAREVGRQLQAQHAGRPAELTVVEGLVVSADRELLRLVLTNLLGNAWKFTARRADARIEFGALVQEGEQVYFVRDNGVGFDMRHAAKLFAPFHRLHPTEEFPGLGVGLATVQRIIHRHGGRAWAEAEVDQGATIYFTL